MHNPEFSRFTLRLNKYTVSSMLCSKVVVELVMMMIAGTYRVPHN